MKVPRGKATFVGAPDVDILSAVIEILRKRIAAGTATFLVRERLFLLHNHTELWCGIAL